MVLLDLLSPFQPLKLCLRYLAKVKVTLTLPDILYHSQFRFYVHS